MATGSLKELCKSGNDNPPQKNISVLNAIGMLQNPIIIW